MEKKKKITISILFILLTIIVVGGITYAVFVFITNSGIAESNSGKLDIAYNIENSSVSGTLIPSGTRSGGISTSVTAKLNSGSIPGNINLYVTPTFLTGMPSSALMWEVDVLDASDNLLTHYAGDFTDMVINTSIKVTDAYGLTTNLLTFNIYIWLNGERIDNTNFNSDNGFTAIISADSISITGEFDPTYTVTFDADGGTGASGTKSVRLGETYGLLPTPTKAGYTFKGWHGKNLILLKDATNISATNQIYNCSNQTFERAITNPVGMTSLISDAAFPSIIYSEQLQSGKTYIWKFNNANLLSTDHYFIITYENNTTQNWYENTPITLTQNATITNARQKYRTYSRGEAESFQVQVEEGSTATTYESYYVTSNVTVTQAKNHTLKAIWEANS